MNARIFDGLHVSGDADVGTITIAGPVTDQAALHGLLAKVRDLGLPLLATRRIAPDWHRHRGREEPGDDCGRAVPASRHADPLSHPGAVCPIRVRKKRT